VAKKAHEMYAQKAALDDLATTTQEVTESGNAVTVTHTQPTKIARIEIKMRNTDEAKSGKMSRRHPEKKT
jgi:hypothetical protein